MLPHWDVNLIPDYAVENGVEFGKVPLIHGWPRPSPLNSFQVRFDSDGIFLGVSSAVPWMLPVPGEVAFPFHGLGSMLLESSDGDDLDPFLMSSVVMVLGGDWEPVLPPFLFFGDMVPWYHQPVYVVLRTSNNKLLLSLLPCSDFQCDMKQNKEINLCDC